MDAVWARRMRWRRRGAWMWPAFVVAAVVDAVVGTHLPVAGESESFMAAGLAGLVLNLIGVILLSRPLGMLVRRVRRDLPSVVARDYAGTAVMCAIAVLLAVIGVFHHQAVLRDRSAMRDAMSRAQAFIGDRAPAEFRRNVQWLSMFAIQPGSLYRACVPGQLDGRTYCVIVNTRTPYPGGVRFGGYEPNWLFSEGVG